MSGETETRPSGWTTDTLKEYMEQRFTDQDKAVNAALQAAKEAVLKAEGANDKRFESVNEFRQTLSDQTNTFLSRPEYDANHKALEDKIDGLTTRFDKTEGRGNGLQAGWGYLAGAIGLAVAVVGLILGFNN